MASSGVDVLVEARVGTDPGVRVEDLVHVAVTLVDPASGRATDGPTVVL